ncbi:hypothetical protein BMS3Bbin04_01463 [bacterium BMS3Bbin04]|nr:hypothetical protein BMS3Bbin04_01463 [bacterium BMS3Bbin04]
MNLTLAFPLPAASFHGGKRLLDLRRDFDGIRLLLLILATATLLRRSITGAYRSNSGWGRASFASILGWLAATLAPGLLLFLIFHNDRRFFFRRGRTKLYVIYPRSDRRCGQGKNIIIANTTSNGWRNLPSSFLRLTWQSWGSVLGGWDMASFTTNRCSRTTLAPGTTLLRRLNTFRNGSFVDLITFGCGCYSLGLRNRRYPFLNNRDCSGIVLTHRGSRALGSCFGTVRLENLL